MTTESENVVAVASQNNSCVALQALLDVSARLGRNPLLVQANSGNTSVKLDGTLWIKASGKWLAHAAEEEILVPVDLNHAHPPARQDGLTPSIETPMHMVVPLAATIHVHSVNTIAWAVLEDGRERLSARLDDLPWAWIPYVPSGMPLAREVEKAFERDPETRVLILANHGLVVCEQDPATAEELLMQVEDRLAIEPRRAPKPDRAVLERIVHGSDWHPAECDVIHTLSTDAVSRTLFMDGVLYPCQAIFLGQDAPILPQSSPLPEDASPKFFLVEGHGVVVNGSMTAAEYEMLRGLAEVLQRVDVDANLRYLSEAEIANVLESEAHRYLGHDELLTA